MSFSIGVTLLLFLWLSLSSLCTTAATGSPHKGESTHNPIPANVPVVFVLFGALPDYFLLNVELASRLNPVVVITDQRAEKDEWAADGDDGGSSSSNKPVKFVAMSPLMKPASAFAKHYQHLCPDNSARRGQHELQNFQRWFLLCAYMQQHEVTHAFFGDGDTSVYADITRVWQHQGRRQCDVSLITPGTAKELNWVSTGCSSLWTRAAIESFTLFALDVYSSGGRGGNRSESSSGGNLKNAHSYNYKATLALKAKRGGGCVVDMSLLWLWNVAAYEQKHHASNNNSKTTGASASSGGAVHSTDTDVESGRGEGWDTGRPWRSNNWRMSDAQMREKYDAAFAFSKKLALPPLRAAVDLTGGSGRGGADGSHALQVCNGLDVVQRTVFDHMLGWSDGSRPLLLPRSSVNSGGSSSGNTDDALAAVCPHGCPSVSAASLKSGGVPESVLPEHVALLEGQRLNLLTLHYQGNAKTHLPYDVCRYLAGTGSRSIANKEVKRVCRAALGVAGEPSDGAATSAAMGLVKVSANWKCRNHEVYGTQSLQHVCF